MSACTYTVHRKRSRGVMGSGIESFTTRPEPCGRPTHDGHEWCPRCEATSARLAAKLADKRARLAWVAEHKAAGQ